NKTAKLIEASIIVPAIVSDLDSKKMNVLRNIAQKIGLLFQITDDLIDFLNGQDKDNLNYPLIFGVDKTKQLIENFKTEIIKDIQKNFPFRNEFLRYVVEKISYREK
ncbi:MAG: polyprenyl synthetase family protein, partial [Elusimicrobiota bacterium]|nr:polyprenyl synthetase family protein [Endomicrobiia bacterium]MDW8166413.1 polyprenyl synthetase family protein [Elusimicrobiota bacterium]